MISQSLTESINLLGSITPQALILISPQLQYHFTIKDFYGKVVVAEFTRF